MEGLAQGPAFLLAMAIGQKTIDRRHTGRRCESTCSALNMVWGFMWEGGDG